MKAKMSEPRFAFGRNWGRFAELVTESRIRFAMDSLHEAVGDLHGKTFLDVGCGSGIHSLAAARLGAKRVHSFDYDPECVKCTKQLRSRFGLDSQWTVEAGSALDADYVRSLGRFDVVYSWGVLHSTGDLWRALALVAEPAANLLVIAVYNDQGLQSRMWAAIKLFYNKAGLIGRAAIEAFAFIMIWGRHALANIVRLRPMQTFRTWSNYQVARGMSPWIDLRDWAGGYPFEVSRPKDVVAFYKARGYCLQHSKLAGSGHGCNEYVFQRINESIPSGSAPAIECCPS
jgi:2-polyprenyl-6-hydroxyphenyl methylase/3-demethylubiquinone-9 3-methyltransferase